MKSKTTEGKGIKQPCNNFKPNSISEGYETTKYPHQCPICGGWRGFCLNCNKDHHENGWNSCKKQTKNCGIDYSKDNIYDAIGRPELNPDNVKDCLFQYATKHKVIEDTDLITKKEADKLVEKYIEDCKDKWDEFDSPELCIWINCKSNVDYHTQGLDIDFRDCILENGHFYRVKKELLK